MNFFRKLIYDLTNDKNDEYQFILGENNSKTNPELPNELQKNQKVYDSLDVNLEYVHSRFNSLINSDVVIREFLINVKGKQFKAFILYIDGMVNTLY